MPVFGYNVV